MTIHAIILAAGLGTRLRPITESLPKPLVPVCSRPLLDIILSNIKDAGVDSIAVNTHYCADKVDEYVQSSAFRDDVTLFHEEDILDTGGPIVNAKSLLQSGECFILHNGDILSDIDLKKLVASHLESGAVATMAVVDGPEKRVRVSPDENIVDIRGTFESTDADGALMSYAGVAVFSPRIFEYLPDEVQSYSIITSLLNILRTSNDSINAFVHQGYWNDLGTIGQLYKAHRDILIDGMLDIEYTASIPATESCRGMFYGDLQSVVEEGTVLEGCILLPGAVAQSGLSYHNEIIGPSYSLNARHELLKGLPIVEPLLADNIRISSVKEQGSDRSFYRVHTSPSRVLMVSGETDIDFSRFIELARFFKSKGIAVPEIYDVDYPNYSLLMEDGGCDTFYDLYHQGAVETSHYHAVIDQLAKLAAVTGYDDEIASGSLRIFDYDYLRWESMYFSDFFLQKKCAVSSTIIDGIKPFFDRLATSVLALPQVIIHRDFQSQNIVFNDSEIRLVDFQGARLGALGFDIASFIYDPYISLDDKLIECCLERYCVMLPDMYNDRDQLGRAVILTSLQRLMQALGAFCFLSSVKGKRDYLLFIGPALSRLQQQLQRYCEMETDDKEAVELLILLEKLEEKYDFYGTVSAC